MTIDLAWLPCRICNGPIMVVWTYLFLFYVTTDAYWRTFNKILFLGILGHQTFFFFFFCMLARGAIVLRMASEKPLLVVIAFLNFLTCCISHG